MLAIFGATAHSARAKPLPTGLIQPTYRRRSASAGCALRDGDPSGFRYPPLRRLQLGGAIQRLVRYADRGTTTDRPVGIARRGVGPV